MQPPARVLVVGARPGETEAMRQALAWAAEFKVDAVTHGEERTSGALNGRYNCLVIDARGNNEHAGSIVRAVRQRRADVAVLVVIESSDADRVGQLIQAGATDYLVWSEDWQTGLGARVRHAIDRARVLSAQHRSAEALAELEEGYRAFFAGIPDAVFILEGERLTGTNPAGEQLCRRHGYEPSQVVGKKPWELIGQREGEGSDVRNVVEQTLRALPVGQSKRLRWSHLGGNGGLTHFELTAVRIALNGRPLTQVIVRDITEQKLTEEAARQSEQRYRALLDHISDAVCLCRREGQIVEANGVACRKLEYVRDELVGMNAQDIVCSGSAEQLSQGMSHAVKHGQATFECAYRSKQGRVIPVQVRAHIVRDGQHQLIQSVAHEIGERATVQHA